MNNAEKMIPMKVRYPDVVESLVQLLLEIAVTATEATIEKVQVVVILYQDGYVLVIGVAGFSRSDKGEFHLTHLVCRGGSRYPPEVHTQGMLHFGTASSPVPGIAGNFSLSMSV